MTDLNWLDSILLKNPGAEKDYKVEWGWDRYMVDGKMFAAICTPSEKYAAQYAGHILLTVKCDPLEADLLCRENPGVLPGFYMDKRCWVSLCLDADLPAELFEHLCSNAYCLVFAKLTKKRQKEISENN